MNTNDDRHEGRGSDNIAVRTLSASSCTDFLSLMIGFQQIINARRDYVHPVFLFRGGKINDKNVLLATIEKQFRHPTASIHLGREMFKRFKTLMALGESYSDWDILSLARHYGLPNRYLDWSSNSLVSLWFAIHDFKDNNSVLSDDDSAEVWVLETSESDFADITAQEEPFPIAQGKTLIFKPTQLERRIKNQDSYMMRQVYVYKNPLHRTQKATDLHIERVNENPTFCGRLTKILLRGCYDDYEKMLQAYGITYDFLFPTTGDNLRTLAEKSCHQVKKEFAKYSK